VVLESLEHAQARGATILAEVVGFGATRRRGHGGPVRRGRHGLHAQAIEGLAAIDYINTHGTSTPVGDVPELRAIRKVFGDRMPPFSSTKSLTGHSLGATGVQEAIFCLIMLNKGFIAGSANVETPDPAVGDMPLVTRARCHAAPGAVQQLRLWRHQRLPGAAALGLIRQN
jgi:3-oxoacyl-[acyl-carrier-protein] synthase-1